MKRIVDQGHYFSGGTAVGTNQMDHAQAIEEMAAERYLLNELAPDAREAFEEHMFDCPECALDIRAGVAFVDEAKTQLPELVGAPSRLPSPVPSRADAGRRSGRFQWLRPVFALPVFAALLLVVGYQNLVTYPALREAAEQPQLAPMVATHGATRGGDSIAVNADRAHGLALPIRIEREPGMPTFGSYSFQLSDPAQKVVWTSSAPLADASSSTESSLSLKIPGKMLRDGSFTLTVAGVGPNGEHTLLQRLVFDVHVTN